MKAEPVLPEARVRAMKEAGLWPDRILLDDFDRWVAQAPDRVAIIDQLGIPFTDLNAATWPLARKTREIRPQSSGQLPYLGRHTEVHQIQGQ